MSSITQATLPGIAAPATFREALAALKSAQKPAGRGAPAYSLYVNRPAGRVIAAAASRLGLTPNAVTMLSAALSGFAIVLLAAAPASFGVGLAVTVLLAAGYAFDAADGQLARLTNGGSTAGEWLDHAVDAVKVVALHAAVLVTAYRSVVPAEQPLLLLLPLGFAVVASVSFAMFLLNDLLKAAKRGTATVAVLRGGSTPLRAIAGLPTDYGVLVLVFLLLGLPVAFLTVYGLLFAASLGYLLLAMPKWYRDMVRFDPR